MPSSPNPDLPSSDSVDQYQLDQCDRQLHRLRLNPTERAALLYRRTHWLVRLGRYREAIACVDEGVALSAPLPLQAWVDRGEAERNLQHYKQALYSYQQALSLQPDHRRSLNGRCYCLAMLNRCHEALTSSDQTLAQYPDDAESWLVRGVIFSMMNTAQTALEQFNTALSLQPDYDRAWYNRGIAELQLGQEDKALTSLERALQLCQNHHEPWYAMGHVYRAFGALRRGKFEATLESCDQALAYNPTLYPAALYRLMGLMASGKLVAHLRSPHQRRSLVQTLQVIVSHLKFRLAALVGVLALLIYGYGLPWVKSGLPIVFSLVIVGLSSLELWSNRARLQFVWQIYLQSGFLTYVRAVGILVATLTTYTVAETVSPPFLQWGWANLVFGQPGNILFQPFTVFDRQSLLPSALPAHPSSPVTLWPLAQVDILWLDWPTAFAIGFWLLLVLLMPFWAQLEEKIFRRGAHTWRKICIRSIQFGLLHLLAGIPILAGFVLIVPGFLFACRYKYVYDRQFRQTQDAEQSMDAGVRASTADHAVYNAILVTLVVGVLTLL